MVRHGFWRKLKKPIFVLAPMADVTDAAFRFIVAKYGKPDVMYTEFVSADGLLSKGKKRLLFDLQFDVIERPIVAQIFGESPESVFNAAKIIEDLGFDGIDINMGCPQKNVVKQGCGAALIKKPQLAVDLVKAALSATHLPVSVKTRIGIDTDITQEWISSLLKAQPAAIIIHARTQKEMSKASAHWDAIARAVAIRNKVKSATRIIGNGDVKSLKNAHERIVETGVDGVMIGRAIFGNPWLFLGKNRSDIPLTTRCEVLCEHILLFEKLFSKVKNFNTMKKHFSSYMSDINHAKQFRMKLMQTKTAREATQCIEDLLKATFFLYATMQAMTLP